MNKLLVFAYINIGIYVYIYIGLFQEPIYRLTGHDANVQTFRCSPTVPELASSQNAHSATGKIQFWDMPTEALIRTQQEHGGAIIFRVSYALDGLWLVSAGSDHYASVWNVETGELKWTFYHAHRVYDAEFTSDGLRLATLCGDYSLNVWDLTDGFRLWTVYPHSNSVMGLDISSDDTMVASCSYDYTVSLRNMADATHIGSYVHNAHIIRAQFSPNDLWVAAGGSDGDLLMIRVSDLTLVATGSGHTDSITGISWGPTGQRLCTGSYDDTVRVWSWDENNLALEESKTLTHIYDVTSVSFSPSGHTLVAGLTDDSIAVWDVESGVEISSLVGDIARARTVAFHPNGYHVASGSDDGYISVWDATSVGSFSAPSNIQVGKAVQIDLIGLNFQLEVFQIQFTRASILEDPYCYQTSIIQDLRISHNNTRVLANITFSVPGLYSVAVFNHIVPGVFTYSAWNNLTGVINAECPAGSESSDLYGSDSTCTLCTTGYYSAQPGDSCNYCPDEVNENQTACTPCPAGSQSDLEGNCVLCEVGYFSAQAGFPCIYCRDEVTLDGTACDLCPAGSESNGLGECLPCESTYYSPTDGSTCTKCFGAVDEIQTTCVSCDIGSFYDSSMENCSSCPSGSYTAAAGQFSCVQCELGKFQNTSGQSKCMNCEFGKYSSSAGQFSCLQCLTGSFTSSATTLFVCAECSPGTYQLSQGTIFCLAFLLFCKSLSCCHYF